MGPVVDPVESDAKLPERTDVVVIGGGIMGTSTAWALAQRGVDVTLCEKGHIGGEQSSRNWGWVRKMGRDSREIPLIIESLRLWEGLNEAVEARDRLSPHRHPLCLRHREGPGRPRGLAGAGPALPARFEAARRRRAGEAAARQRSAASRAPSTPPSDGRAEPQKAAPASPRRRGARAARSSPAAPCAGIETSGGRVSGVVTEKGRIACASVVLAGGAWSRLFSGSLGLRLPQLKVLASVLRTEPVEGGPGPALFWPGLRLPPAPRRRLHHRRRPRQRSPDRAG